MDRSAHLAALAVWLVTGSLGCASAVLVDLRDRTAVSVPLSEPDEVWVYRFEEPEEPDAKSPPPVRAEFSQRLREDLLWELQQRGIPARSADAIPDPGVPHNLLLVRGVLLSADPGAEGRFFGLGTPESRMQTLVWIYRQSGEVRHSIQEFETRVKLHGLSDDTARTAELISDRLFRLYVVQAWLPAPTE